MPEVRVRGYCCERCGHVWVPRLGRKPVICPKCKSPYWDRPVERLTVSQARKKTVKR